MSRAVHFGALLVGGALALACLTFVNSATYAEKAVNIAPAHLDTPEAGKTAVAVLAGGCFWGMEGVFERVKGVRAVVSGYAGGTAATANYDAVSSERTGHAEAIRITYDPAKISYGTLLRIYFSIAHDPTQLNRQGPDSGTSYRSAIFPQSPAQRAMAEAYIAQLSRARSFSRPIVTKVEDGRFFPAESYHQDFMTNNPGHPYIVRWDVPKVKAFRAAFPTLAR
ncbi:MAG: peptide-methionine (S)-S-oxide reductase MsrA [Chakrabartia godavariana]